MWTCPKCRSLRIDSENRCPECGAKMPVLPTGIQSPEVISLENGMSIPLSALAISSGAFDNHPFEWTRS